jgi:hypothetical protein
MDQSDSLRSELEEIERRGRHWHSHQGNYLYVGVAALGFFLVHVFGYNVGLGSTGAAVVLMVALACFGYVYFRREDDARDIRRAGEIREILDRSSRA